MTAPDGRSHRTYAVPFDAVWKVALALAGGGLSGLRLVDADDRRGVIHARRDPAFLRPGVEVRVDIGLDEDAQTRVALEARAPDGRAGPRAGRGLVARFLDRLDAEVARAGAAAHAPTWSS